MFGRAEFLGLVQADTRVLSYFPEWSSWISPDLTLHHLLHFASGIQWNETYEYSPLKSDVLKMLYGKANLNMPLFVARQGQAFPPGKRWAYSSGDSNLLMASIGRALERKNILLRDFIEKEVLLPLGVQNYTWEEDAAGHLIASSYFYVRPDELFLLGQNLLQMTLGQKPSLFSDSWLESSAKLSPFLQPQEVRDSQSSWRGGAHWWVNEEDLEKGIPKVWEHLSAKALVASGHWGQLLVIDPESRLVFVRFANDRQRSFDLDRAFHAIKAMKAVQNLVDVPSDRHD